jgi:hypothetical protein
MITMITIKRNIGHDDISLARAKAEAGDPRQFVEVKRKSANVKVILKSRPYADNRIKQGTFYLKLINSF